VTGTADTSERIAKFLARAGVASRREVERMIEGGRIKVDGKTLDTPAFKVTGSENIEVDGKRVEPPAATKLWRYHKPDGLVTTHADPEGRETVFDAIPKDIGRVISIGRLDLTSEGLLLLTNDGALARALELPSTGWTRRYRARAFGSISESALKILRAGVTVEGIKYGPMEVEVERETGSNIWLEVGIREGKNREVRKALDAVGLRVNRLIRIAYGPFQLGQLNKGEIKSVPSRVLHDQCGHLIDLGETPTGQAIAKPRPPNRAARKGPGQKPGHRAMGGPGQPGLPKRDVDDSLLEEARKGRPLDAKSARARRGKDGKPTAKPAPGRAAPRASSSRTETPRTGGPRKPGGPRTGGPKTGGPKTGGPRKPGGRG
jgi:23S rRNA pseudouridine2605 synthase